MYRQVYNIVNGITIYRLVAAPLLLMIIMTNNLLVFKWLLALSFCTDAIDGYLARRFGVNSAWGSRLDSIADDLTVTVAIIGVVVFKPGFFAKEMLVLIGLLILMAVQHILALIKYRKLSSFHTYAAKVAAVLQGIFLVLFFMLPAPVYILYYTMLVVTAFDIIEEIILVLMIPVWTCDVKGVYWVLWQNKQKQRMGKS